MSTTQKSEFLTPDAWLDVTYPISEKSVSWPGQPQPELSLLSSIDKGDTANVSLLSMSVHSGTHMDAPVHFLAGGEDITTAPFEAMMGRVRVVALPSAEMITKEVLEAYEAQHGEIEVGERLFFRTRNSDRDWSELPFDEEYVAVVADGASYLTEKKVAVVGVDYLSVAPFVDPAPTHRILLSAGVWIIEGLDLRHIEEGSYEMLALPLKIEKSDASPVRVLLRPSAD